MGNLASAALRDPAGLQFRVARPSHLRAEAYRLYCETSWTASGALIGQAKS